MNRINRFKVPEEVTPVIESYIDSFEASTKREKMSLGVDYYRSENTAIMNTKKLTYVQDDNGNAQLVEDPYKANNKLPSGYLKLLINQKVNYLLGNEPNIETENDLEAGDFLPNDWVKKLRTTAKEASQKAKGWLQPYISEGKFKLKEIPAEQVIPVYRADNNNILELVIRYYSVDALNEDNQVVQVNRVEVWDDEEVTYYQQNAQTMLYNLLTPEEMELIFDKPYSNPKYHFQKNLRFGDKVKEEEGLSWGKVPFIPLFNNEEEDYDLQPVKRFIDAYDKVNSDFMNNLEDFQEVYWILKGYQGQNLNKFLDEVKRYKTLKVGDDGEARSEQIDIPHAARKEAKAGLEKDIFNFGMGVNPNNLEGGSITNVVIKSRFANLDLKCDQFEDEVKSFLDKLIYFVNSYREETDQQPVEVSKYTFNRSMIINEVELLNANINQRGSVSEQTRLSNHPWVDDADKEIEAITNAQAGYISLGEENE